MRPDRSDGVMIYPVASWLSKSVNAKDRWPDAHMRMTMVVWMKSLGAQKGLVLVLCKMKAKLPSASLWRSPV